MMSGRTLSPDVPEGFRIWALNARLDTMLPTVAIAGFRLSALGCRYRRYGIYRCLLGGKVLCYFHIDH